MGLYTDTVLFCDLVEKSDLAVVFSVKKLEGKMAMGKNTCEDVEFGLVRSTSFGRKRVCLPNIRDLDFISTTPTKKLCRKNSFSTCVKSPLEALPQDILVSTQIKVSFDLLYLN